jgi:hypothetical protein
MNAPSNPLRILVYIRDHAHFEAMNDFVAFSRHLIKDYTWYHGFVGDPVDSHLSIEFHDKTEALLFKLKYG